MKYEKIPTILKRYSFDSKMDFLMMLSTKQMGYYQNELKLDLPLPWYLETFLLFALKAEEWQYKKFDKKTNNEFFKVIECIYKHVHPLLKDKEKLVNNLMITHGLIQFDLQKIITYKYYRYNYFFTYCDENINMKNYFYDKFNISFKLFMEFGLLLNSLYSTSGVRYNGLLSCICEEYSSVFQTLMIDRENFNSLVDKFSNVIDDYEYCIRPSYMYPFIKYHNETYFPLPHCINRAVTDSLLYRLTESNNALRDSFGKNVLENYLFDIISESELFVEVLQERRYITKKGHVNSPDLMCRNNDEYLFFELKSLVPNSMDRCMNIKIINQEKNKISDAVVQLYNQFNNYLDKIKEFFDNCDKEININKCYGIVVLLEDPFIEREEIYNYVAKKLNMSKSDEKYNWLINHIKVCDLYDIEKFVFSRTDILEALKKESENNSFSNFLGTHETNTEIVNKKVLEFRKKTNDFAVNWFEKQRNKLNLK